MNNMIEDEEIEVELEAAENEFLGDPTEDGEGTQLGVALQAMSQKDIVEHSKDILIALGFTRYDNGDAGIAYKLHVGPLQVGRTYTSVMPNGNMWVRCLVDCEDCKKGEFMKRGNIKQIPQVDLFYKIRDGELQMPEPNVTGKVVGKSEKAVQIQFSEFNQIRTEWWGLGALKKTQEGVTYILGSYSKETETYTAKMQVPRDILLIDYEAELKKAPMTVSGGDVKHKEQPTEKVEKRTLAEVIVPKEPITKGETISERMRYYLVEGRKMVEQVFPELEQPQLSELSQDIATSMFIEGGKVARKERW